MTPETWADIVNWMLVALGGAMVLGTGAALLSYRRTGVFPGQPTDEDGLPVEPPAVVPAVVRVGVGAVILLWGLAGMASGRVVGLFG